MLANEFRLFVHSSLFQFEDENGPRRYVTVVRCRPDGHTASGAYRQAASGADGHTASGADGHTASGAYRHAASGTDRCPASRPYGHTTARPNRETPSGSDALISWPAFVFLLCDGKE
jgi:hypothetical protein